MAEADERPHQEVESSSTLADPDLYCLPCYQADDQKEEAIGFCKDCNEHLCRYCYRSHSRSKTSSHHTLLDEHDMPRSMSTLEPNSKSSNVRCTKHANKRFKYFCLDHEVVLCSVCSTLDHRQCKIEYIPDYAASYLDSEHGRSKLMRIKDVLQSCERVKKLTQGQLEDAERNTLKAIEDLEQHRSKIVTAIDKELEDLKDKAVKFRAIRRATAGEIMKQCDTIQTDVTKFESTVKDMKSSKSNKDELFIQIMQSQINLDNYEMKIDEMEKTKLTSTINFSPNADLSDMAKEKHFLGCMDFWSLSENTKVTKVREVNVKASGENNLCEITGIEVLSDNTLASADWENKSVKVINAASGKILHVQQLPSEPWDLTAVPGNKLAVSLCNESSIQFLSTEKGLTLGDTIPCQAYPNGIKYHKWHLVVSFNHPINKVEILSLKGDVVRSFSPGLSYPFYVTVSNDSHILISDCGNQRVLKLDWTGRECGSYTDCDLKYPRGLAVSGDGWCIICSRNTNTVHLVSENCKKLKTLLNENHGVKKPFACCYDEKNGLLYVGFESFTDLDNSIAVYQLT